MNDFIKYLKEEKYSETTIDTYVKSVERFIKWCKKRKLDVELIDYKTFLKYVKHSKNKGITNKTLQHQVGTIKIYFNYLISESYRTDNPIENVAIKGIKKTINHNLLDPDELEDLYYSFETENLVSNYLYLRAKRNKVIVGLMVYQGLTTSELINLEIEDLELYKGKIYIKSTRRSNARTLELKSWQVIEFLEYIKEIREELLKHNKLHTSRIFIPNNKRLGNTIQHIFKKLKRINNKAENIKQIRASVITNWLKQYNLRQAQYLAGHRYISSTERYLQDDLENLHEIVNNFHPIN